MMIVEFYASHPMWTWLIVAALILVAELSTGTGWLLWPAASAAVVAIVAALLSFLNFPGELVIFAVLATVSSLTGHRYLKKQETQPGDDINDRAQSLIGRTGRLILTASGRTRVDVDGAEWDAETTAVGLETGARVKVVKVLSGSRLEVDAV